MSKQRRTTGVRQILAVPGTKIGIVVAIGALAIAGSGWASASDRPADVDAGAAATMALTNAAAPTDLGPRATAIASFTATEAGTYVLDATMSVAQTTRLAVGSNPELACTWQVGVRVAGPTFRQSLLASSVLRPPEAAGLPTELTAQGQARLAAGESATFDCSVTAPGFNAGDVQATAVTYRATRVA